MLLDRTKLNERRYERISEQYLIDERGSRTDGQQDWKTRMDDWDHLYAGEWATLFPNESAKIDKPKTMNQAQVECDDIAALVKEADITIRIRRRGDSSKADKEAALRQAIAEGYWEYNRGRKLLGLTAMDLAGVGAAFWYVYVKPGFDYPALMRLDPRTCYPTVINGELIDLMRVEWMKARTLYAKRGIEMGMDEDEVEIISFYDSLSIIEMAWNKKSGETRWIDRQDHGLKVFGQPVVPICFAQRDAADGAFRGMFDQMDGNLMARNRIAELILDNADQMVYAPIKQYEVENAGDFGPLAVINMLKPDSVYERVAPSQVSGQLFALLQSLEMEGRSAGGYPAQRQGQQVGSIISGAGVSASMGQLTTTVRGIGDYIADMREQHNQVAFAIDEMHLNFDKPLCRTVENKKTYTPKDAIQGEYANQAVLSAGAGLDKANQYVLFLQLKGAQGIISDSTIRSMVSEVTDTIGEEDIIAREESKRVMFQKLAAEATLPMMMQLLTLQDKGMSLEEAVASLIDQAKQDQQQQQQQGAPQPGAQPAAPGGPMAPADVQAQQTSLEKGGVPGQAPAQQPTPAQTPPFEPQANIFVGRH